MYRCLPRKTLGLCLQPWRVGCPRALSASSCLPRPSHLCSRSQFNLDCWDHPRLKVQDGHSVSPRAWRSGPVGSHLPSLLLHRPYGLPQAGCGHPTPPASQASTLRLHPHSLPLGLLVPQDWNAPVAGASHEKLEETPRPGWMGYPSLRGATSDSWGSLGSPAKTKSHS